MVIRRRIASVLVASVLAALLPPGFAAAQEGPAPSGVSLTPESDTAAAGTCNEFTVRVTGFGEPGPQPVSGATVDVLQTLASAGTEPSETRELGFCNPQNALGPNPTGQGGTSFGDVTGNNPQQTAGDAGRNTTVRGEVGPTNANGEVTFGITIAPETAGGSVSVTAWVDFEGDDDAPGGDEPVDTATKTWTAVEQPFVTSLDAGPESASNPNGTQHTVTVTVRSGGAPVGGVVPQSVVAADATARPPGDVVDPGAGPSPNFVPGKGKASVYACSASDAQGISTCTFQDPLATGPGTDTIVFFVDLEGAQEEANQGDPQDAVQKTWFTPATGGQQPPPAPPEARNVLLCHDASPAPCDTSTPSLELGGEHTLSVLVTDRAGAPLGNVPVQLRHTGPADFAATGTDTVIVTTGSDGTARAVLDGQVEGTSTIVAEIAPPGTAGSFRGPGGADDECEQPAGAGGTPPAGNCVSQALTVSWEFIETVPMCDDGVDNDGDGYTDFPDDPSCSDVNDDTESPVDFVESQRHDRRINMRFRDREGPANEGLVIFGRLRLEDETDAFRECTRGQPVYIQRLVDGRWKTKTSTTTKARGRYEAVVSDKPGRYRAVAPRTELVIEPRWRHSCRAAKKAKTHHHGR